MNGERRAAVWGLAELGAVTAIAEAVLLREGMTAFAGSELAWALVLTAWLLGVAAGSRGGARGAGRWATSRLAPLVVLLAGGGVVALRALPALAGAAPGETATAWRALWVWPVAVLPPALAGGLAFPILAGRLHERAPARAYALEAAGACAGGLLFTFVLAPLGTGPTLVLTLAVVVARRLVRRPWRAALALLLGVAAAGPAGTVLEQLAWRCSRHPGTLKAWAETRHQRLELASGPPLALYADGRLAASYPDPWQSGTRGHLLMLLHPAPRRVLAVDALEDGTVEILLRHPLKRLDLVEEDPRLLELLPRWYGSGMARALADHRVHPLGEEPLRAVRRGGPWDLVLLLDADPSTLRRNRTRTVEFFRSLRRHLAPAGRVVVATGFGDTYLGGAAGELLAVEAATLRAVFPHVTAIPGERLLLVAGADPLDDVLDPGILAGRWCGRGLTDPVFSPEILPVLLDPLRAGGLRRFLEGDGARPNRAADPTAVLPAMALAEGRGAAPVAGLLLALGRLPANGVLTAAAVLGLLLVAAGRHSPRAQGEGAAFAVGLASMGSFVILLAAWQSTRGSVYVEVGGLTAGFMAGAAAGALTAARWNRPQRHLPALLTLLAALFLLLAGALPFRVPAAVPLLLAAVGALAGAAFPGAAVLAGTGRPAASAARGFSADEAGAAAGALVTGLLLPATGVPVIAQALAGLLAAAALATLRRQ